MIQEAAAAAAKAIAEAERDTRRRGRYRSLMDRCDGLLDQLERWNLADYGNQPVEVVLARMIKSFQREADTDNVVDLDSVQLALDSLYEVQNEIMSWAQNALVEEEKAP